MLKIMFIDFGSISAHAAKSFAYKHDVFISHAGAETEYGRHISRLLREKSFATWYKPRPADRDERWSKQRLRAFRNSASCVILFGKDSFLMSDEPLRSAIRERTERTGGEFRIIPVLLPGADRLFSAEALLFGLICGVPTRPPVRFGEGEDEKESLHQLILSIRGVESEPEESWGGFFRRFVQRRAANALNVDWVKLRPEVLCPEVTADEPGPLSWISRDTGAPRHREDGDLFLSRIVPLNIKRQLNVFRWSDGTSPDNAWMRIVLDDVQRPEDLNPKGSTGIFRALKSCAVRILHRFGFGSKPARVNVWDEAHWILNLHKSAPAAQRNLSELYPDGRFDLGQRLLSRWITEAFSRTGTRESRHDSKRTHIRISAAKSAANVLSYLPVGHPAALAVVYYRMGFFKKTLGPVRAHRERPWKTAGDHRYMVFCDVVHDARHRAARRRASLRLLRRSWPHMFHDDDGHLLLASAIKEEWGERPPVHVTSRSYAEFQEVADWLSASLSRRVCDADSLDDYYLALLAAGFERRLGPLRDGRWCPIEEADARLDDLFREHFEQLDSICYDGVRADADECRPLWTLDGARDEVRALSIEGCGTGEREGLDGPVCQPPRADFLLWALQQTAVRLKDEIAGIIVRDAIT